MRHFGFVLSFLMVCLVLLVSSACSPSVPGTATPTLASTEDAPSATPGKLTLITPIPTEEPPPYPQPVESTPSSPYPEPQQPTPAETGPVDQPSQTSEPYPFPEPTQPSSAYPYPEPAGGSVTPTMGSDTELLLTQTPTLTRPLTVTPVSSAAATAVAAQQATAVAVNLTPNPLSGKVVMSGKVTVWHSLNDAQVLVLQDLVRSFVRLNPDVSFEFQYISLETLRHRYYSAAYLGGGPSLLIAPAEWGADYYAENLVENLNPYIVSQFQETILPAPLSASRVAEVQVALPVAQTGLVLYRNTALVESAPQTLAELETLARQATRAGRVGLYIDLKAENSSGFLPYQGGQWLDAQGQPVFNADNYSAAKTWLSLLQRLDAVGGVEFNQSQSYAYFEVGRVGMTFADVRQRSALAATLGVNNLAIDPWPSGMGGWVKVTAVYLNSNVAPRSSAEHNSALLFMGALLSSSIQEKLANAGLIPVLRNMEMNSPLDAQAYQALAAQTAAYPPAWGGALWDVYIPAIEQIVQDVLLYAKPADQVLPVGWQAILNGVR